MHFTLKSVAILALSGFSVGAVAATAIIRPAPTQLPRSVRPSHYDVSITPDAATAKFKAKVAIDVDVLIPTSSITLNAADLTFQHVRLVALESKARQLTATVGTDPNAQTATFKFAHPIAKGRYTLTLDYSGVIGTQAAGLFALDYDTPTGQKRALFTQFENSDARRMIPSWDEPNYKATFSLEATVPSAEMAVSNMPVTTRTDMHNGYSVVKFAESPKMSTYLLFFSSGDFERATASMDGTELGVITKRGDLSQAAFVLDQSKAILHEYNDYFGIRYPLPKLDNIAAPGRSQFFEAMENWGAIFSFEYGLLQDPSISTQHDKQEAFLVVAHEMAHQWFGDLVTMQWWDEIWLNEGFATWMESRMSERLHPEWNTALNAVPHTQHAMQVDALKTTHPVVQHIRTVEQANQAFDAITYAKGEAVIRMLENYVGADTWRDGVRAYMKEHQYGNTVSSDFWRQIDKAAGKPVSAIAHDFTLQPGVPMIEVSDVACHDGKASVTLTQSEFSKDQADKKPLTWRVPVVAQVVGSNEQTRVLVTDGQAKLTLSGCGTVLVNVGQKGYYRTLYTKDDIATISANFAKLEPIDQLGLLSDSVALGMAGLQPLSDYLNLAQATPTDADPQVWEQIAHAFGEIHDEYKGEPERRTAFDAFAIARLASIMTQVGWSAKDGELATIANLRETLIETLSQLGDAATVAEARRRYGARDNDLSATSTALRRVVMNVVARHADPAAWDRLHAEAQTEKSPLVKAQMYELLASAEDTELVTRALMLALTSEPGATTSGAMMTAAAKEYPDLTFDFAILHIDQVNKLIDNTSSSRFFPRLASGSMDPDMVTKINVYAIGHLQHSARGDADKVIAGIQNRVKRRAESLSAIDAWLAHMHRGMQQS